MKMVVIGAGSRSFGRGVVVDTLTSEELVGHGVELVLVDLNENALDLMTRFAHLVREHTRSDVAITSTTDRRKALKRANYVLCAVAIDRWRLWEQDFRIPLSYGFNHCLGENGGPGALFHALRNLQLVMPICKDIEKICPDALLLNFTNPEARILAAILTQTEVKAVGLCHGVFDLHRVAAKILGRSEEKLLEELEFVTGGMNHLYWVTVLRDRKTGRDVLPVLKRKMLADKTGLVGPLAKKVVEAFDGVTYPSDDHIGEYLSFATEFTGTKWPYGLESRKVDKAAPGPQTLPLEDIVTGKTKIGDSHVRPSGELAVPIICDIKFDRKKWRPAVNVLNADGYVNNLPRDAAVEVPAVVDAKGVHPQHIGDLPEICAAVIRTQCSIQKLLLEAYRTRSKRLLLQALLLDPVVNSASKAEAMLDDMLELQKEFLPAFS